MPELKDVARQLYMLRTQEFLAATATAKAVKEHKPRIYALAVEVFEDAEHAGRWLISDVESLGNKAPLELLEQGHDELVENVLNQIKYGMFS